MSRALAPYFFKRMSLFAILLAAATIATAQKPKASPSPTPIDEGQSVITNIRRVRLPITVTDKKGSFVPGLTKSDFVILEDKVPQVIETFSDDISQLSLIHI